MASTDSVPKAASRKIIDLGCGPDKVSGAVGVDFFPYPGVDIVLDLDASPWPLKSNSFDHIYARHFIEHVADIRKFLNEIHRIGRHNAIVEVVTPHFSSVDSWKDPTHRWHFSSGWHLPFTQQYMAAQLSTFEHRSTVVGFGNNVFMWVPRLLVKIMGYDWWEKHFAFIFQARNITTKLRIKKEPEMH